MTRLLILAGLLVLALQRVAAAEVAFLLTDPKGAPVGDAVVSLIPLDPPPGPRPSNAAKPAPNAPPLEIAQDGKEFQSLVTPIVVGTTVNFPNFDSVEHQVYSLSPVKKFELPLYKPGRSGSVTFDRPGVVVLGCNIHAWMLAYVVVLDTPWFAKSGRDGTAFVSAVPPGRYRAEVWHPTLKKNETREVTIASGTGAPFAFTLAIKPIPRIRRTPDAAGSHGY